MGLFIRKCGLTRLITRAAVIYFTFDAVIGFDTSAIDCRCWLTTISQEPASDLRT